MFTPRTFALLALSVASLAAHAQAPTNADLDAYAAVGIPGITVGLRMDMGAKFALRAEHAGGLKADRSGDSAGVNYNAKIKLSRAAVLLDWHPFANGFRATTGLSFNNMSGTFAAKGGLQDINGKSVDLTGRDFRLNVEFPRTTPYVGIGWTSKPNGTGGGLGLQADLGLQIGKFNASVAQNIVGINGITQADVNAELVQFQEKLNKLRVIPNASIGASYRF